ncbi:uncharacterized protein F5Z01DRAFT_53229 [Emericellopsis atlantica]|uniref:Uncharacterized protein n=1 Tax=Emericellopsis atlantica TaxID=2614577 RepID=A0A9P8CQ06_9HYPO|nr:uncharacterized protein F5Z01DRAFT_53229 [Emericellopsis atlantica]KAG9255434.1 hypothetical protein F5Z01DRAFT_53229 [Emericellopsis atlantica]
MSFHSTQSDVAGNVEDISAHEGDVSSQSSVSSQSEASFDPMEDFEGISYSQEATTRAFRDYYAFLAKMYVDESCIAEPPPDGWPSITSERYRGMGKTDTVVELLRHLPYLVEKTPGLRDIEAISYCHFYNFERGAPRSDDEGDIAKVLTETHEWEDFFPPHVFGFCSGENDPDVLLLDTQLGLVYWLEAPGYIKFNDGSNPSFISPIFNNPSEWAPASEQEWREEPCWSIPDFFEMLKQQFIQLQFIPLNPQEIVEPKFSHRVEEIYRQFGWPDLEKYRKEECQAAVRAFLVAREETEQAERLSKNI